jgi:hypothetical protein
MHLSIVPKNRITQEPTIPHKSGKDEEAYVPLELDRGKLPCAGFVEK